MTKKNQIKIVKRTKTNEGNDANANLKNGSHWNFHSETTFVFITRSQQEKVPKVGHLGYFKKRSFFGELALLVCFMHTAWRYDEVVEWGLASKVGNVAERNDDVTASVVPCQKVQEIYLCIGVCTLLRK